MLHRRFYVLTFLFYAFFEFYPHLRIKTNETGIFDQNKCFRKLWSHNFRDYRITGGKNSPRIHFSLDYNFSNHNFWLPYLIRTRMLFRWHRPKTTRHSRIPFFFTDKYITANRKLKWGFFPFKFNLSRRPISDNDVGRGGGKSISNQKLLYLAEMKI